MEYESNNTIPNAIDLLIYITSYICTDTCTIHKSIVDCGVCGTYHTYITYQKQRFILLSSHFFTISVPNLMALSKSTLFILLIRTPYPYMYELYNHLRYMYGYRVRILWCLCTYDIF